MTNGDFIAIIRPVPDSIGDCELTHLDRTPIDLDRARSQHVEYASVLSSLGCRVIELPALHDHPDSVFVEDTMIVLDELAVMTRPGAPSRRDEVHSTAEVMETFRPLVSIEPPGRIDGGDVLRAGRTIFVGCSSRSDEVGLAQLREIIEPVGYNMVQVDVHGCLHLKTGATALDDSTILCNPAWLDTSAFTGFDLLEIDPDEPFSGNVAQVGSHLIADATWTGTNQRLEDDKRAIALVQLTELAKAEGSVTCSSILFPENP